jgi:ribosomal protein S18 acetylase RimI-like enzyme
MDDFIVRPATQNDVSALGRLGALLLRTHYAFDQQRFMEPGADAEKGYGWFLRSQLNNADAVVLVAERKEAVVGYVYAGIEPQSWKELREEAGFIHDVAVDKQNRKSGVARALIEAAVAWLQQRGMKRVLLWTADQNAGALRLFSNLGFRRTMVEMTREIE